MLNISQYNLLIFGLDCSLSVSLTPESLKFSIHILGFNIVSKQRYIKLSYWADVGNLALFADFWHFYKKMFILFATLNHQSVQTGFFSILTNKRVTNSIRYVFWRRKWVKNLWKLTFVDWTLILSSEFGVFKIFIFWNQNCELSWRILARNDFIFTNNFRSKILKR